MRLVRFDDPEKMATGESKHIQSSHAGDEGLRWIKGWAVDDREGESGNRSERCRYLVNVAIQ